MQVGTGRSSGRRRVVALALGGLVAAVAGAFATAAPPVAADPGPVAEASFLAGADEQPPTAAAVQRATDELLRRPAYRGHARPARSPRDARRHSGGSDPGGGNDSAGQGDAGGRLLPRHRFVTLYGAPQLTATAVGMRSPRGAARKIVKQARPYRKHGERKVVAGFDLIAAIATSTPGPDRKYRTRQSGAVIDKYLRQARKIGGRLVLDIQPGRASIRKEIRALRPWIAKPNVDVGIDPEWNVGRRGVPGRDDGSIKARELNRASRQVQRIVDRRDLPPKLLVVHQFRKGSVRQRRQVRQRKDVSVLLNFDGIGSPSAKRAGYKALSTPRLFNGFSIFYDRDTSVMTPRRVLRLRPEVDFLLYQ